LSTERDRRLQLCDDKGTARDSSDNQKAIADLKAEVERLQGVADDWAALAEVRRELRCMINDVANGSRTLPSLLPTMRRTINVPWRRSPRGLRTRYLLSKPITSG